MPPDEHPWIEQFGCTRSYRRLREAIRAHYRQFYPLTSEARQLPVLNPGNAFVSQICHEPRVSLAVIDGLLRPFEAGGQLTILRGFHPIGAQVDGDRVECIKLESRDGQKLTVEAPYFVDATETGDLLPLTGTEYVTGAESRHETGEPHAADEAAPHNMQAISWCFVVDYRPGEDHRIEKPRDYDFWRDYIPPLDPPWPGKLLDWSATHPITLEPVVRSFDPLNPKPERGPMDLWTFRRIADRTLFRPGSYQSDIVLVNWPQIDYLPGNIIEVSESERREHLEGARQLSLCKFYWMQTEAPREDGGQGWAGLRLRPDITGTSDGLARKPYIREARRLRGKFTVLEQHIGLEARRQATGLGDSELRAETFPDTVGVGAYRIDLHPSTGGDNYIDVGALPFQIPLGALIPKRVRNLLAGGKNLSVTHITNGCYRLHPVEWNVGEAAGCALAYCLEHGLEPQQLHQQQERLLDFQNYLVDQGFELDWPRVQPL